MRLDGSAMPFALRGRHRSPPGIDGRSGTRQSTSSTTTHGRIPGRFVAERMDAFLPRGSAANTVESASAVRPESAAAKVSGNAPGRVTRSFGPSILTIATVPPLEFTMLALSSNNTPSRPTRMAFAMLPPAGRWISPRSRWSQVKGSAGLGISPPEAATMLATAGWTDQPLGGRGCAGRKARATFRTISSVASRALSATHASDCRKAFRSRC